MLYMTTSAARFITHLDRFVDLSARSEAPVLEKTSANAAVYNEACRCCPHVAVNSHCLRGQHWGSGRWDRCVGPSHGHRALRDHWAIPRYGNPHPSQRRSVPERLAEANVARRRKIFSAALSLFYVVSVLFVMITDGKGLGRFDDRRAHRWRPRRWGHHDRSHLLRQTKDGPMSRLRVKKVPIAETSQRYPNLVRAPRAGGARGGGLHPTIARRHHWRCPPNNHLY